METSQMTEDLAVEVEDLWRGYGAREAVRGLNLSVHRGGCHGFFGRNGAGKTTTLKCLLNHLRPARGKVRLFGIDPQRDEVGVKSRIGYVPDEVAFYPWMTVRRTLDYMASFRRHWNRDLEHELLNVRFELDESLRVDSLSKGMKAQLALVAAICPEPELLLLDEPLADLDEQGIARVTACMRELEATTLIIASPTDLPDELTDRTHPLVETVPARNR